MAKTQDYLDYLCNEYDIAPANSQEELQAAQAIAGLFDAHGLEPTIQEFDAPAGAGMSLGVPLVILFVSILLSGIGSTVLSVIAILLGLASVALLVMRYLGNDVLDSYGPTAKSQNVIGFHEATGELAAKGNRPIVVVAHYDTPREDFLWNDAIAPYMAIVRQASVVCVPIVGVALLFQAFGFLPDVFRRLLWVVGIIAALPLLLWGISIVASRFMGCTPGANNNKSGVAAMLGVMDNLRPSGSDVSPSTRPAEAPSDDEGLESDPGFADDVDLGATCDIAAAGAAAPEPEPTYGVRHGREVLESLHVLPETCWIEYHEAPAAEAAAPAPESAGDETRPIEITEPSEPVPSDEDEDDDESGASDVTAVTAPVEPTAEPQAPLAPAPAHRPVVGLPSIDVVEEVPDPAPTSVDPDSTVLVPRSKVPATDPADAPSARRSSPARRASLFDLPNPAESEVDPLDNTDGIDSTPESDPLGSADAGSAYAVRIDTSSSQPAVRQEEIGHVAPEDLDFSKKRKRRGLFGRKKKREEESMSDWLGVEEDYDAKKDGRQIGSWDNFGKGGGTDGWKGGATTNGRFRVIEGSAPVAASGLDDGGWDVADAGDPDHAGPVVVDAPDEAALRQAVLSMGDDELISHDIWFVALGGSSLGHAGMKAFLGEYRRQLRGAFLFNLSCVGSGTLTVLGQEGLAGRRRADRRLVRLLKETASSIHVDLADGAMPWGDTDATPAMRTSLRSVTILGCDDNGLPALAHSLDDVEENLDRAQVERVADLVTEVIRRS